MNKVDDGGPAFPQLRARGQVSATGEMIILPDGMSLRDWFAGQALMGLVSAIPGPGCAAWDYYSDGAYHIADAMLAARKRGDES